MMIWWMLYSAGQSASSLFFCNSFSWVCMVTIFRVVVALYYSRVPPWFCVVLGLQCFYFDIVLSCYLRLILNAYKEWILYKQSKTGGSGEQPDKIVHTQTEVLLVHTQTGVFLNWSRFRGKHRTDQYLFVFKYFNWQSMQSSRIELWSASWQTFVLPPRPELNLPTASCTYPWATSTHHALIYRLHR